MNFFQRRYSEIKNFFKSLFSSADATSSKRVVGFSSFFCMFLAEMGFYFLKDHPILPQFMWWGFVAITSACFALNVIETLQKLNAKFSVATDMINKDPSIENSDNAKETLQSDKP